MDGFLSKIGPPDPVTGCRLWQKGLSGEGYGVLSIRGRLVLAHRAAYALAYGEEPPPGKMVLHECGVRRCLEPTHLYAGDGVENAGDARRHGTQPAREKHWAAKLTEQQAREVHRRYGAGELAKTIAEDYGVSKAAVNNIAFGMVWGLPSLRGRKRTERITRIR